MSYTASSSLISFKPQHTQFVSSGSSFKPPEQRFSGTSYCKFYNKSKVRRPGSLTIQASANREGAGTAGFFIGGFVLGGIVAGTLGCVFAPQIRNAMIGNDRKDLMKKLPTFIYDEEKALKRKRKKLAEKIAQLNSSIDEASVQLHVDDNPNGSTVNNPDEMQTST